MDTSALLNALAVRSSELEHWEYVDSSWLHLWTGMVVVGVAFELGVIFFDFWEDLHAFRRSTIRSPERPSVKKLIFEVFSCALVVIGVAGEFFVARATEDIGTELRIISNERVGIAEEDAGIANKEAGDARKEAGDAKERTSENEKEASKLRKRAEDEALARAEIEERIANRSLSGIEQNALRDNLANVNIRFAVKVTSDIFARDGERYAQQFLALLLRSGIAAFPAEQISNPSLKGIFVCAAKAAPKEVHDAAIRLRDALMASRIHNVNDPDLPPDWVGPVPEVVCNLTNLEDPQAVWLIVGVNPKLP